MSELPAARNLGIWSRGGSDREVDLHMRLSSAAPRRLEGVDESVVVELHKRDTGVGFAAYQIGPKVTETLLHGSR
jgi:hypothetical protein